jgi:ferredoxin
MTAYSIEVRNRERQVVRVDEGRFLLRGLEDGGMRLPFGCRFGACLTCAASLVEGEVDHSHGRAFALRDYQQREGYILLCVAQPRSDCVIEVGVRRGLYRNAFRSSNRAWPTDGASSPRNEGKVVDASDVPG